MSIDNAKMQEDIDQAFKNLTITIPSLPLDTYGVIAEILAGDQAFKTLASLNVASHAVRDETLPVLFETVLFDGAVRLHDWVSKRGAPAGFRYTKFLMSAGSFFETAHDQKWLPNLALTMVMHRLGFDPPIFGCNIYLHKPLASSTVFGCISKTRMPRRMINPTARRDIRADHMTPGKPFPAEYKLNMIRLDPDCYLRSDAIDCDNTGWTTNLSFKKSYMSTSSFKSVSDSLVVATICELWKLLKRQSFSPTRARGRQEWLLILDLFQPLTAKLLEKLPLVLVNHPELSIHGIRISWRETEASQDDLRQDFNRYRKGLHEPRVFRQPNPFPRYLKRHALATVEVVTAEIGLVNGVEDGVYPRFVVHLHSTSDGLPEGFLAASWEDPETVYPIRQ